MNPIDIIDQLRTSQLEAGDIIRDHFRQKAGELETLRAALAADQAPVRALVRHPENLSYSYYRELLYWNNSWRDQIPAILHRLDPAVNYHCPAFVFDLIETLKREGVGRPRLLDFGCGPFSNLCAVHKRGAAEILGIDALAEEYLELYRKFGIEPPIPLRPGSGETLSPATAGGTFDFCFVQNALDHTACPALTWLNLYAVTNVGGFLGHCHAVNEATHEKQDQLHQFNLRPEGSDALVMDDLHGQVLRLTDGLELELHFQKQTEVRANYVYFTQIWRKKGNAVSAAALRGALEALSRSFVKRSRWAFTMEDTLLAGAGLADGGLTYGLRPNKP